MEWKNGESKYSSGESLWLGDIKVGTYFWGGIIHEDKEPYKVSLHLPGFTLKKKSYATVDDAKKAIEGFVRRWFSNANKHLQTVTSTPAARQLEDKE